MAQLQLLLCLSVLWLMAKGDALLGDPQIVAPYPDNLYVIENEKAKETCVVTDTAGAKPDKIVFIRKSRFGDVIPILDEGPSGRIYYENITEDGGKKLMVTLHFNKVIVKDDSRFGGYECHGYTGAKSASYGFTVSVIPQIDLPRAVVKGTTATYGGSANLTCDVTYQGNQMNGIQLEKVLWIRNFTVIGQGSVAIAPITVTKATTRDGGAYVCKTQVRLRRVKIVQITMGTATLNIKLKMDDGITKVAGTVASNVVMECPAEGYPLNVTWMRVNNEKEISLEMSQRYVVTRPCPSCRYRLTIYTLQSRDQGRYVCTANSSMESGQHHFQLSLTEDNRSRATMEVRLMDGKTPLDGRVEVRKDNGQWSTICNNYWDIRDAYVVCHMLNYSKAVSAGTANVTGSGPIYPKFLNCFGSETSIEQCNQVSVNCDHSRDAAAVACGNLTSEEKAITVRLVGTNVSHVGQVDIQYNGTWGAVCHGNWDIQNAHVICRMLGYKAAERSIWFIEGEATTTILMDLVGCSGKEKSIAECSHPGWWKFRFGCSYKRLAGVVCQVDEDPPPVQVRLAAGRSPNSGRVEVRYHGAWGTVCNYGWDTNDAEVVCRMLGYTGVQKYKTSDFNSTKGIIWLMSLGCTGREMSIANCSHSRWGKTKCDHGKDVGVTCKMIAAPQFIIISSFDGLSCTAQLIIDHSTRNAKEKKLIKSYEIRINKHGNSFTWVLVSDNVSNFTIGDGKYYNGHHNVPLEPGTTYNVAVRAVTRAQNGRDGYGATANGSFTCNMQGMKVKIVNFYRHHIRYCHNNNHIMIHN